MYDQPGIMGPNLKMPSRLRIPSTRSLVLDPLPVMVLALVVLMLTPLPPGLVPEMIDDVLVVPVPIPRKDRGPAEADNATDDDDDDDNGIVGG